MKDALQPYLRAGLACRKGVSKTNYEQFVAEVQDLANELENIPQFGTSRGSIQAGQNYENQPHRTLDAVPKENSLDLKNFRLLLHLATTAMAIL
ncbi:hypothetical protein K3495_g4018 [Podosphaera aphanis]|nr:hypothetical protein K3495_g4018 [Podosphaera aphanis]